MKLEKYREYIKYNELLIAREAQYKNLVTLEFWQDYIKLKETLVVPALAQCTKTYDDSVTINGPIGEQNRIVLEKLLAELHPWRKGPFQLFGIEVDAEWRSELKWQRISPLLGELKGKKVGDIGCNNGYYMLRLVSYQPELVLGLDPNGRFFYQFELLNSLFREDNLLYEPLGVEHADIFPDFFDLILCLGVIYHRRDPVESLKKVFNALNDNGRLIIESITVPGDKEYALIPKERYSMMRNVWFVPSPLCLGEWLKKAGFRTIEHIDTTVTTTAEQRKTKHCYFDSLCDFLDPNDRSKTVEGYPAPARSIFIAEKG